MVLPRFMAFNLTIVLGLLSVVVALYASMICLPHHVHRALPFLLRKQHEHIPQVPAAHRITCFTNCLTGNVLCQVATTLAMARRWNMTATFPTLRHNQTFNIAGYRVPLLSPTFLPLLTQDNVRLQKTLWRLLPMDDFVPSYYHLHGTLWTCLAHRPLPDLADRRDGLCLVGSFLSFRYFEDMQPSLQRLFGPPVAERARLLQAYGLAANDCLSVSMHVRRNDILNPWNPSIVLGAFYYDRAVQTVMERLPPHKRLLFIVCSDDIAYVRQHWKDKYGGHLLPPSASVRFSHESDALADFHLMSLCDHHIVANSTFSGWSAFLAKPHADKIITCPDRMSRHIAGLRPPFEVFPEHWTVLPALPETDAQQ